MDFISSQIRYDLLDLPILYLSVIVSELISRSSSKVQVAINAPVGQPSLLDLEIAGRR
jgi:hypothetical protein